jgi:hypothetical protein
LASRASGAKRGDGVTDVGTVEAGGGVDLAGQKSLAQGPEGHQPDAQFLECREDIRLSGVPTSVEILLVADVLHPVDHLSIDMLVDGYMGHRRGR